jgi:hypothetical protein
MASRMGWRSVFGMELPAAVTGLAISAISIPPDRPLAQRVRYDLASACLWFLGLTSLLWLLGQNRKGLIGPCGSFRGSTAVGRPGGHPDEESGSAVPLLRFPE